MPRFKLISNFKPAGDQSQAIAKLTSGLKSGAKAQTLLGVTGSGKTFTLANVIEKIWHSEYGLAENFILFPAKHFMTEEAKLKISL